MLNPHCFLKLTIESANFLKDADTFGKQDPFIKVTCAGIEYKTKTIQEGGKDVVFNETFELTNIAQEIKRDGELVLNAYDSDGIIDELIGTSVALEFRDLINSNLEVTHSNTNLELKGKSNGRICFKTQYIYVEPPALTEQDEEEKEERVLRNVDEFPLNEKCYLQITILNAQFLKDSDLFGKQDPFVEFTYQNSEKRTSVKDNQGKNAEWNEEFTLENIQNSADSDKFLQLKAYDQDPAGQDFLGQSEQISYHELSTFEGKVRHNVDLVDEEGKQTGKVSFQTEFIWVECEKENESDVVIEPVPEPTGAHPDLNSKSVLRITIQEAQLENKNEQTNHFISFIYQQKNQVTSQQVEAVWNETFQFPDVMKEIQDKEKITFELQKETENAKDELLCSSNPFDIADFAQNLDINTQTLDLLDGEGNTAGSLKITTQLILGNEDFAPIDVNDQCKVELEIRKVQLLKEADYKGPYVQFFYHNREYKTMVQEHSNENIDFDDVFTLSKLLTNIDGSIRLKVFDKGQKQSKNGQELLGSTFPIDILSLVQKASEVNQTLELFYWYKLVGTISFKTKFVYREELLCNTERGRDAHAMHLKQLLTGSSVMQDSFQTEGMKSLAMLKDRQFESNQLNAKVNKLIKEDMKSVKALERCEQEQEFMIRIKSQKQNHQKMILQKRMELSKTQEKNRESYNNDRKLHLQTLDHAKQIISRNKLDDTLQIKKQQKKIDREIAKVAKLALDEKQQRYARIKKERELMMKQKQNDHEMLLTQSSNFHRSKIDLKLKTTKNLESQSSDLIKKQEELVKKLKEKQLQLQTEEAKTEQFKSYSLSTKSGFNPMRNSQQFSTTSGSKSGFDHPNFLSPRVQKFVSDNQSQIKHQQSGSLSKPAVHTEYSNYMRNSIASPFNKYQQVGLRASYQSNWN